MKKVGNSIGMLVARLSAENNMAADALRRAVVNDLWKTAVVAVFKTAAPFILNHTNAVYIMSGEQGGNIKRFDRPVSETRMSIQGKVLVVYSDDSIVRSDIDNRQELLKLKFKEGGEDIEVLRIVPSTRDMKQRHPFQDGGDGCIGGDALTPARRSSVGTLRRSLLSEEEKQEVEKMALSVEDAAVRKALTQAMEACKRSEIDK